ncbi:MAG: hypothetical protein P4N41_09120 [Negativicutes bacterium]|nr:hypothetical protein [Negativicutes bacterium]
MPTEQEKSRESTPPPFKECFVIMPISDPDGYDKGHFERVYRDIFCPAIYNAGFQPRRADDNNSSSLIQLDILKKLLDCPIAICDLSSRNPNVLFELGIRQSFDKPVLLVQEVDTPRIFDIASINTIDYRRERVYDEVLEDQRKISKGLVETMTAWEKGTAVNSIIKLLSINRPATLKNIDKVKDDPAIQYIMAAISDLRSEILSSHTGDGSRRDGTFSAYHGKFGADESEVYCQIQKKEYDPRLVRDLTVTRNILDGAYKSTKDSRFKFLVNKYNVLLNRLQSIQAQNPFADEDETTLCQEKVTSTV